MKTRFLLSHRFKKLGWWLFFPSLLLACVQFFGQLEPVWLNLRVPQLLTQGHLLAMGKNNIADELASFLLLLSCMLLVFSRERDEDEMVMKLRLESVLWAALINGVVVMVAILLAYDFTFFHVMVFNLFLLFILFIIRFHWVLNHFRQQGNEE